MAWIFFFRIGTQTKKKSAVKFVPFLQHERKQKYFLPIVSICLLQFGSDRSFPGNELVLGTQKRQRLTYLKLARRNQIEFRGIYVCACVSKKKKRQDVSRISVISKSHPFFYVVTFTILTFLSLWMILVESKELQNQCYFFSF